MSADGTSFGERLKKVQDEISRWKPDGDAREIQILAVSKGQDVNKIADAFDNFGHRLFGENYVQEAMQKQKDLAARNIEWHFIGHLQSNKVKSVIGAFDLIHSVDRLDLIKEIHKRAEQLNARQKVLIEVNIANENSKSGVMREELFDLVEQAKPFSRVKIEGLMCMPPLGKSEKETRGYFSSMRELAHKLNLKTLSMGTSEDYGWAVAEGATVLRLGTILFGARSYV